MSKMDAIARARLTFQMLDLLNKYAYTKWSMQPYILTITPLFA